MTARELIRILRVVGAQEVRRGKGSHRRFRVGACSTTVPFHAGEDLRIGTLGAIERQLEPCLGERWLRRFLGRDD